MIRSVMGRDKARKKEINLRKKKKPNKKIGYREK